MSSAVRLSHLTASDLEKPSFAPTHQWESREFHRFFQDYCRGECSDFEVTIRAFTLEQQTVIEALMQRDPITKETFSVIREPECYVNGASQRYYVLSCSTSIFSSKRLQELMNKIHPSQLMPAAVIDGKSRYFAPDMLQVEFTKPWPECYIGPWARSFGLSYYEHKLSGKHHSSAFVHLPQSKELVSIFDAIQQLPEIASVQLHELPEPAVF